MARGEPQATVTALVARILGAEFVETPVWLMRPVEADCGGRWALVCAIYNELTGLVLPDGMPPRERRQVDAVLQVDEQSRILEVDETQHFNRYRALTLRHYPEGARVAFPIERWIERSEKKLRLEGGGFGKPKPPLFPAEHGRHMQRAFRDMLADLLPPEHGFAPTLRIADFEVTDWLHGAGAEGRMRQLLSERL
ncbi:MAG: hypothetical protein MSC30_11865 [Gaiellaceae bacterium MAG52_C11]|nr:hypothetical protein [Candidatus Gaiellasilicea maunaloa]